MSCPASRALLRYVVVLRVMSWALAMLVGSACALSQTSGSEHAPSRVAPDAATNGKVEFELGSFASVHTAEITTPLAEQPLMLSPLERGESRTPRRGLDRCAVEHTIQRHLPTIRACYEREFRRDPSLSGKVTVAFMIQPNGQVREPEAIENSTGSEAVAACVARVLRHIHFAPSVGQGAVSCVYPFLFGARR